MADEDDVSSLLELFGGRFDPSEMESLLRQHGNNKRATAAYLMITEPSDVRKALGDEGGPWTLVQNLKRFRREQLKVDRAKKGVIHTSVREFSCMVCDTFWWRRVPKRKMVSTCKDCRVRYRAIPRKREWGVAEYTCPSCYNNFKGWGQMNLIYSPCYKCGHPCKPEGIIPPSQLKGPRRKLQHSCLAPDCYNRYRGPIASVEYSRDRFPPDSGAWAVYHQNTDPRIRFPPGVDPNTMRISCVHPRSRKLHGLPVVVEVSEEHQSSGSTVATFLDQGGLKEMYEEAVVVFSPPLPTIGEE